MPLSANGSSNLTLAKPSSIRITGSSTCHYCGLPVNSNQIVVLFSLQKAGLIGAAHAGCGYFDLRHAQFTINRALAMDAAETSFLGHFYVKLFSLPGQGQPQSELRHCLAGILLDYPGAVTRLPDLLAQFKDENRMELAHYRGDLETGFYMFLGQVQKAALAEPLDADINFIPALAERADRNGKTM